MPWLRLLFAGHSLQIPKLDPRPVCFWWIKWQWNKLFSEYSRFPLSVTFYQRFILIHSSIISASGFGGLEVTCWPLVPKFVGSNLAEAIRFFRVKKSSAHLPSEGLVKPFIPCHRFTAHKRSLNVTWKLGIFRQNSSAISCPSSSSFHY